MTAAIHSFPRCARRVAAFLATSLLMASRGGHGQTANAEDAVLASARRTILSVKQNRGKPNKVFHGARWMSRNQRSTSVWINHIKWNQSAIASVRDCRKRHEVPRIADVSDIAKRSRAREFSVESTLTPRFTDSDLAVYVCLS